MTTCRRASGAIPDILPRLRRSRGWLKSCMEKPSGGSGMDVVAEEVTQIFGGPQGVVALDRFSHRFRSRRFSCILGPSGCGKSTLIQIVGGLEPATGGTVRIQDPARPEISRPLGAEFGDGLAKPQPVSLAQRTRQHRVRPRDARDAAQATLRTRPCADRLGRTARISKIICPASCPAACASASRSPAP